MDTYVYGGIGVTLPHSIGLRAFGVIPAWDPKTRKLKARIEPVRPGVLVTAKNNYLECPLSDLLGSRSECDPQVVLISDYARSETFAFLESTWWCDFGGTITLGGANHIQGGMSVRPLPPAEDIRAISLLGPVMSYGGMSTYLDSTRDLEEELFKTGARCHERKLEQVGTRARIRYAAVMAELSAIAR